MSCSVEGFPAIPALQNYFWFLTHDMRAQSLILDPGEAIPFIKKVEESGKTPVAILITHGDIDHMGGVKELRARYHCPVFAPADITKIPLDYTLAAGQKLKLIDQNITVIATSGHRRIQHFSFYFPDIKTLFSGDCLFISGCGRLFGNSPETMWKSLSRLRHLPEDTKICGGHNYSLDNMRFACSLESDRTELQQRLQEWESLKQRNKLPCFSLLRDEKIFNPFLRADDSSLQKALGMDGAKAGDVFAEIRKRKDDF